MGRREGEKQQIVLEKDYSKYDFKNPENYFFKSQKGLSPAIVEEISKMKKEPKWMLDFRLKALQHFIQRPLPKWGADLTGINFDDMIYYIKPTDKKANTWEDLPPEIKNTFDRLGIPEAEKKFLAGVGAQYECLSGDMLVLTNPKGPVKIKEIKLGDKIFSFDENTNKIIKTKVNAISLKGKRKVFSVKIGTRSIKATINHPFLSLVNYRKEGKIRGRFSRKWVYLKDLKIGDLVAVVKEVPHEGKSFELPKINFEVKDKKINLPEKTSEDFMWFLGLYLGDGYISKKSGKRKARVEVAIPKEDTQLQNELMKVSKKLFGYEGKKPDEWRITINSILAEFLEKIGFQGKAKTKRIPQWVYSIPKNEILAFLGGYVDSDGYVRNAKRNHDISITSVNKKLLESIVNLCFQLGISSSTIHEFESKHPFKNQKIKAFRLQLSGNFDQIKCRSVKRLERMNKRKYFHKFNSAHDTTIRKYVTNEIGFAKVKEIKYSGIEPVYDIEVDGPHNFIAQGILVHNSDVVYHSIQKQLSKQGVIFTGMDQALIEHEDIVKKYFGTVIPYNDNKFAALNSAVWSGGSFVYIPEGVHVQLPLQAYFRINAANMGQFERTLIIAEENSSVHYLESCTAPIYSTDSLHAAVVEIIAKPGSRVQYTTIQNWSSDVYNLVTKRAFAYENATVFWIDANIGSKVTMKYPSIYLLGEGAKGEVLSVAFAGKNQHLDAGAKVIHVAKNTQSTITSKSVSKDGGRTTYRGLLKVMPKAVGVKSNVRCVKPDTFILGDNKAIADYNIGNHAIGLNGLNTINQKFVNNFEGEMIKIKAVGMFPVEITPEHPVLTADSKMTYPCVIRNGKHSHTARINLTQPFWKDACLLKNKKSNANGNYLVVPKVKGNLDIAELDLIPFINGKLLKNFIRKNLSTKFPLNENTAWLLGLYVAEGYSSKGHIKFALNSKEHKLKNKVVKISKSLWRNPSIYKKKSENCIEITLSDAPLSRAFEKWCGKYAYNKQIPEFIILHKNEKIVKSFLDGFISGDGCISQNCLGRKNIIHIVTTSKLLALQLQLIGARLGQFFRITKASRATIIQDRKVNIHDKFDVRCNQSGKIHAKFDENFMFVPIRKIEKINYKGKVYNLETSDHSYIVSNAITHNCDALILDDESASDTIPYMEINEKNVSIGHEASVGKISEEQLFYLMSRGLNEAEAMAMIIRGFIEPFTKQLPLDYAVEMNRLIELQMEGSVG